MFTEARDCRDGARGPEASPSEELPGVEMRGETQEYAGEAPTQAGGQDVNRTAWGAAPRASSNFDSGHLVFQLICVSGAQCELSEQQNYTFTSEALIEPGTNSSVPAAYSTDQIEIAFTAKIL